MNQQTEKAAISAWRQGDLLKAESIFLDVLTEAKKSGVSVDIKKAESNLCFFFSDTGQWRKLLPFELTELHDRERSLGPRHPRVAEQLWIIANNLHRCMEFSEAEDYCRKAIEIQLEVLPADHRHLARSKSTLDELQKLRSKDHLSETPPP